MFPHLSCSDVQTKISQSRMGLIREVTCKPFIAFENFLNICSTSEKFLEIGLKIWIFTVYIMALTLIVIFIKFGV